MSNHENQNLCSSVEARNVASGEDGRTASPSLGGSVANVVAQTGQANSDKPRNVGGKMNYRKEQIEYSVTHKIYDDDKSCVQALLEDCLSLHQRLQQAEAKVAELEAVVGRLPKTADGVPIMPGMRLFWHSSDRGLLEVSVFGVGEEGADIRYGWECYDIQARHCYSTRSTAIVAKGEGEK